MKKVIFVSILCCLSSGCASIFCGDSKTINVSSTPSKANFIIKDKVGREIATGITPTNVTLKRGSGYFQAGNYTIQFDKDGFESTKMPINQGLEAGWYLGGNIIVFGGLIGILVVDPITGAMWNIDDVHADLRDIEKVSEDGKQLQLKGYRATIDETTGKPVSSPVYEEVSGNGDR